MLPEHIYIGGAGAIALVVSYLMTPLVRKIALRLNVVDHPNHRKVHLQATPLMGGLAVFFAFVIATLATSDLKNEMVGILLGGSIIIIIGMVDDNMKGKKSGLFPNVKLAGQVLASLIAIKFGLRASFLDSPYLSIPFTVFWMVGITNAINLLDNMNGLSVGVSAISAAAFGVLALSSGDTQTGIVGLALAGACLGFLRYNFPKADIFVGDAGALFMGFALSAIAIMGNWRTDDLTISLSLPILILAYPIFDTTLVTISRILRGHKPYQGGKDHSSHRLVILGLSQRWAVVAIYIINVCLGIAAFLTAKANLLGASFIIAGVAVFLVVSGLVLGRVKIAEEKPQPEASPQGAK
jgi:UDP-GlcNAc:undecaprenyl-phosphate GlcNAc-1-phosphate transferase